MLAIEVLRSWLLPNWPPPHDCWRPARVLWWWWLQGLDGQLLKLVRLLGSLVAEIRALVVVAAAEAAETHRWRPMAVAQHRGLLRPLV